eukprot:Skav230011  [mRNA]  locus=scaffold1958:375430:381508:+ [translate_table: standard]
MPGPWIQSSLSPGWLASQNYEKGMLVEFATYDDRDASQGKVLAEVKGMDSPPPEGATLAVEFLCVEDPHLAWWWKKGPGKDFKNCFKLHLCNESIKKCKGIPKRRPEVFHTDLLRSVDLKDLKARASAWWISSAGKKDFEAARSRLLKAQAIEPDDMGDDLFSPHLDSGEADPPEGEGLEVPAKAEGSKTALERKLKELKRSSAPAAGLVNPSKKLRKKAEQKETSRKKDPKGKKGDEEKEKKGTSKEEEAKKPTKRKASRNKGALGQWFGKKKPGSPEGERSDEPEETADETEKKESSSSEAKAKKKRKSKKKDKKKKSSKEKKDRGPYGSGRKSGYGKEAGSESSSDEEGSSESFHAGAPEKRSQQLVLMEYADRKPGRLAARLLQKMGVLTNRTGAPLNLSDLAAKSSRTPACAVQYYHTILFPQNKDKMNLRLQRELLTLSQALDFAAAGSVERCADLLCQRLKALELNLHDQSWQRAQFLELIPLEGAHLADTEEQRMASKEQAAEARSRQLPHEADELDQCMAEYINCLYQDGEAVSHAGWLLSGFKRFLPSVRRDLVTAQQYYNNWIRDHVPQRAVPMPWDVAKTLSAQAYEAGQYDLSLMLLLGFCFFLRTMELVLLTTEDIHKQIHTHSVVITLTGTKTSRRADQSLVIQNESLCKMVSHLLLLLPKGKLWRYSPRGFRQCYAALLAGIGATECGFTVYSLRRGGATHTYVHTRSLDHVAILGRWKDHRTARIYLDDARAALLRMALPQVLRAKIWHFRHFWRDLLFS